MNVHEWRAPKARTNILFSILAVIQTKRYFILGVYVLTVGFVKFEYWKEQEKV